MAERREKRSLTQKGREYLKGVKLKTLDKTYKKLNKLMNDIDFKILVEDNINTLYMQWLILYDQFMDTNEEYRELLDTGEKEDHDMNMGVSCLTALSAFKANAEKYMLKCHPKPASVSVCPQDSASQAGRAGKSSVSKHSRTSVSSVTSNMLRERQKKAELEARRHAMEERHKIELEKHRIELEKLHLKMREEKLTIKTELDVSIAKSSVLDSFMQTRSQVGFSDTEMNRVDPVCNENDNVESESVMSKCSRKGVLVSQQPRCSPSLVLPPSIDPPVPSSGFGVQGQVQPTEVLPLSQEICAPYGAPPGVRDKSSNVVSANYSPIISTPCFSGPTKNVAFGSMLDIPVSYAPAPPIQTYDTRPYSSSAHRPVPEVAQQVAPPLQMRTPCAPPEWYMPPTSPVPLAPPAGQFQDDMNYPSQSATAAMHESTAQVARLLRKPSSEIKKFSGDPMDYKRFLRQFNSRVVVNADTEEECMNYLEQFTDGEAHRVVCGFGHLDNGYHAALQELDLRYGNPRVIVSSFIRKALDWHPIRADDPKGLNEFSIFLSECLYAVKSVNTGGTLDSLEDLKRLISKLPFHMHDRWRNRVLGSSTYRHPDFDQFVAFVREEARKSNDPAFGREAISKYTTDQRDKRQGKLKVKASYAVMAEEDKQSDPKVSITNAATSQTGTGKSIVKKDVIKKDAIKKDVKVPETAQGGEKKKTDQCAHCSSSGHLLDACLTYSKLPILDKFAFLRARGMCFGCLEQGHMRMKCTQRKRCDKCHRRHPTVLHDDDDDYPQTNSTEIKGTIVSSASVDHPDDDLEGESTMAIIPVMVRKKNSAKEVVTYAFLDPGSTASFITDDLMRNLGCEGKIMKITLETLGRTHSTFTHVVKGLEVVGLEGSSVIEISRVYSRKDLPVSARHIPTQKDIDKWRHLDGIKLPKADCGIGLLIGNNVPDVYTPLEVRTGPIGSPHATLTRIGWIPWNVIRDGPGMTETAVATSCFTHVITEQLESLETLVRDSINRDFPERAIDDKRGPSREDVKFLEKMESGTMVNGHYVLPLPFRDENVCLPDNREQAQNRLRSLKRRLIMDESKMSEYKEFMDKVTRMGYAEEVPDEELHRTDGKVWYIPHHGVNHPKTGKFRVVFDCSAKFQGISLNDTLLQGPNLTSNLMSILLCFRQEPVALSADIEAMFYQVQVPKEDRDCMRYFWWPDGDLSKDPRVYRKTVHVFGAVSSPACSSYALQCTADGKEDQFTEEVLECLRKHFYVDDFLKSVLTDVQAIHLSKWNSVTKEGFVSTNG